MSFKVMSHAKFQPLPEEEVVLRLKNIIHTRSKKVCICEDLSLLDENNLPPFRHAIWSVVKHFDVLKTYFFRINSEQSFISLRSIEKEIAKGIAHQQEIELLFRQAISIYNLLVPEAPYSFLPLPIHKAVLERNLHKVITLVRENPNYVYQTNSVGETPLHVAIKFQLIAIAHFLVSEQPNPIEEEELGGNSPLHLAVETRNIQLVQLILSKHISPYILNKSHQTPLDIAKNLRSRPVIKLLEEYEALYYNRFFETH